VKRKLGLDVVRGIAILLVIISHSNTFFQGNLFLDICGLLGVEIFFVLSGFLIGGILIKDLIERPTYESLKKFYIRRWLRTLPVYYLVLLGVFAINQVMKIREFNLLNLIFLQNFSEKALGTLPVSWSLSVEEWFYLLMPLCFLIAVKLLKNKLGAKKVFFIVAITVFFVSFGLRIFTVLSSNPMFDYGIRKQIFLRFDTLMFGVLLAGIKVYYKDFYVKFNAKTVLLLSLVGFSIMGSLYAWYFKSYDALNYSVIGRIFLFDLISLSCMFLVVSLDKSVFVNAISEKSIFSRIFTFLSVTSYGIYLIHLDIYYLVHKITERFDGLLASAVSLIISVAITLVGAYLLHILWERPFMNLRDNITLKKQTVISQ
jgi:peptidoglycan/LPS O-acetylase OafA/YrhL